MGVGSHEKVFGLSESQIARRVKTIAKAAGLAVKGGGKTYHWAVDSRNPTIDPPTWPTLTPPFTVGVGEVLAFKRLTVIW